MEKKGSTLKGIPIMEPKKRIAKLYNYGIMNLLEIPHFNIGKDTNSCVKQIFACVHGGFLWMDRHVPINVNLIAKLTGLSIDGVKME
jgi:hypothetical protein